MRVLILWSDQRSANMGVRVLAQGMSDLAHRVWGSDVEITCQDLGPNEAGFSLGKKSVLRDILKRKGPIRAFLSDYDVVLDTGAGDSFTDIYGWRRLAMMSYTQRVSTKLRIPYVMGPQTIGPFNTKLGRALARGTLRNAQLVVARDQLSADYALTVLGREIDVLSTDVVFALDRPKIEKTRDVILNVSGLLWFGKSHVDGTAYRSAVRRLISTLISEGRAVTLLAHVVDNPTPDNDVPAIEELQLEFGGGVDSIVPSTLEEAREVIASAKVLVGSRMHATLNALSVGVPAVPWAYSRKFAPLMGALGWRHTMDLREIDDPVPMTVSLLAEWSASAPTAEIAAVAEEGRSRMESATAKLRSLLL